MGHLFLTRAWCLGSGCDLGFSGRFLVGPMTSSSSPNQLPQTQGHRGGWLPARTQEVPWVIPERFGSMVSFLLAPPPSKSVLAFFVGCGFIIQIQKGP